MKKVQRLVQQRTNPFWNPQRAWPFIPRPRPKPKPKPGARVLSQAPPCCPALAALQKQKEAGGRSPWHLLNWGRCRGECVGCLYLPLRRRSAGAHRASSSKIWFPHILPPQNTLYPSGRRKQSIKQVWLWCVKGVFEDLKKPSHRSLHFFQTSSELERTYSFTDQPKGVMVLLQGGHNQCLQDVLSYRHILY
jgi:hypothetical protein